MSYDSPTAVSISSGDIGLLTFSGTAGEVMSLAETNNTYPNGTMVFTILKPDGTTLTSSGAVWGSTSLNSVTLPTGGTYTVLVNPGSATGGATFTLTQNIAETLGLNAPLAVSSIYAGQVFDLTFSGAAGEVVSLAGTNNTYPNGTMSFTILKPDGTTLSSSAANWGSASLNNVTLPQSGTYTVLVNPGAATGGATFTLTQNITEALSLNAPLAVSSIYAGQVFDLTFSGTAGEVVSLAETNNTYPNGTMSFTILKPDGTTLSSSAANWGSASLNNVTLPTGGTYTVLVNPGAATGGATFTLTQNITEALSLDAPQAVSSTYAGQVFDLTFTGTAGEVVSLAETNNSYPNGTMVFTILNPDGTTLTSSGAVWGSASLNNETLPQSGTYTVLVNPGAATGGAAFTLTQNITEALSLNTPLTVNNTNAGQVFHLTFSGTAGEVVSLAETNNSYPNGTMVFTILNPDGTTLTSSGAVWGSASLNNVTLPQSGTYTVLVNPGAATGGATFTLTQNITEALSLNTPLTVRSAYAGQVFDLTFSGTAGEVVSLAETNNTYPNNTMSFTILKPDGTTLSSYGGTWGSASLNNVTLPTSGTYTVLVNPGATTGSATFTLTQNITEALSLNTPLAVSSTYAGQVFDLTFSGTAGAVVSLAETNNTYPNNTMSFTILKPDGTTLSSYGGTWGSASLNNVTLPAGGTYTVLVNPGATTGSATFTLTQNMIEALSLNTPLAVSSTYAGQVFDLTFSGTAGAVVSLAETNNTYPNNTMSFTILKSDGTTLSSSGGTSGSVSLNNITLPAGGTYTVLVNPGAAIGGATFTLTQ